MHVSVTCFAWFEEGEDAICCKVTNSPPTGDDAGATREPSCNVFPYLNESGLLGQDQNNAEVSIMRKSIQLCNEKGVKAPLFDRRTGNAGKGLCEMADVHSACVLVVGSDGSGALRRLFKRSVSEYCARNAKCTVMIVKPQTLNRSTDLDSSRPNHQPDELEWEFS